MTDRNLSASIRARLLNKAKMERQDFNQVLTRYGLERILYRLGQSEYAGHFLLKGALLFDLWFDIPHRPTRDIDLLAFGSAEIPRFEVIFRALCAGNVDPDDGMPYRLRWSDPVRSGPRNFLPASDAFAGRCAFRTHRKILG